MNKIYYYLFDKIYKYFYFYCISGRSEERELLLRKQSEVENTGDNILTLFFQIMKYADGTEQGRNWENFLGRSRECRLILEHSGNAFDKWCFHQILSLSYTYIYPDVREAVANRCIAAEVLEKLSEEEKEAASNLAGRFDREDYEIRKHLDNNATMVEAYKTRFAERDFRIEKRSFLMILKGFSSSTPFFYPALENRFYQSPIKGGGFFLKWQGYGIAIDPGINFMENMHLSGLEINDINAVIVTHDHIDHNGDLQVIDDLAYSFKHNLELYVDKFTYSKADKFACMEDRHLLDVKNGGVFNLGENKNIRLEFIDTRHIPNARKTGEYLKNTSFALKISLLDHSEVKLKIGITSDSEYFPELGSFMKDCDYIIANISEPEKEDYEKKELKQNHLGYNGCLQLIENCNAGRETSQYPRYIISEFWAGRGDARRELIRRLRKESKCSRVYPGDIGMMFFLDRPGFLCDHCRCEMDLDGLHIIREKREYGRLSLVCNSCLLL